MWTSLILLCHVALCVRSALSSGLEASVVKRDISETIYQNLEFFAQYAGAGYCPSVEDSPVNALVTCNNDVCPLVESAGAYEIVHFDGSSTDQEGFIAIDPKNNLIVVSFRGSDSLDNFLYDILFTFTSCEFGTGCEAEYGFYASWLSVKDVVVSKVASAVASFPTYKLVTTGHSLGGAVATIAGAYLRDAGYPCDIYTYGSPRAFNTIGADYVTAQTGAEYRVTHFDDPVPRLPPLLLGYAHTSPEYWLSGGNATTTNYPISSIEVCPGDKNVSCNAGETDFDVTAHHYYFEVIGACNETSSESPEVGDGMTDANIEQKTMLAKLDIAYALALQASAS